MRNSKKCNHEYKKIQHGEQFLGVVSKTKVYIKLFIQKCIKCGDTKKI